MGEVLNFNSHEAKEKSPIPGNLSWEKIPLKGVEAVKRELTPVQGKRIAQAYNAIKNRKGDLYPMHDRKGHVMFYLTSKELATRTLGPRPSKESKEYQDWKRASLLEQERREVLEDVVRAIVDDDMDTANKLIDKYQVVPTRKQIDNEIQKRGLSRKERDAIRKTGKLGKRKEYQLQREGESFDK